MKPDIPAGKLGAAHAATAWNANLRAHFSVA